MPVFSARSILPVGLLMLGLVQQADRFRIDVFFPSGLAERVDVTVENGPPMDFTNRMYGKGNQLRVDASDFPTFARTGLHSEKELDATKTITGKLVEEINRIAQPGVISGAGSWLVAKTSSRC